MDTLQAIYFGQRHKDFTSDDFDLIKKIKRLAMQDHKQCTNSCNGYGVVRGQRYYLGIIDDYAKRKYGYNVKDGYINDDENVFDAESERIREKINAIVKGTNFRVEYQGDPRGATVKLYYDNDYINL